MEVRNHTGTGTDTTCVAFVLSVLKGKRDARNCRFFRSFTFLGTCEGELFGILGTPTKIVQSEENVAANADVPSAPFCIAALLVTIVVAWR